MRLKRFVEQFDTVTEAAKVLGVSRRTLTYWLAGNFKPRGLSRKVLKDFSIENKSA